MYSKRYLCLLGCLIVLAVGQKDDQKQADGPSCECGVFNSTKGGASPLMSQKLLPTGCDDKADKDCMSLCVSLVQIYKDKGPELMCELLGHADKLKASVFSRVCGKDWVYTGVTCDHELCCHEKKRIDCQNGKEIAATS